MCKELRQLSENINYHRCTHSNYAKLVADLIQYGACTVDIGQNDMYFAQRVANNTFREFSATQKKESGAIEVLFKGFDETDNDYAKYVLVTSMEPVRDLPKLTKQEMSAGLRVRLHSSSGYYNQCPNHPGTVIELQDRWWRVKFDNGYSNSYQPSDLCLAEFANNKQAVKLLKKE